MSHRNFSYIFYSSYNFGYNKKHKSKQALKNVEIIQFDLKTAMNDLLFRWQ